MRRALVFLLVTAVLAPWSGAWAGLPGPRPPALAELEGRVELLHLDDFEGGRSDHVYRLETDRGRSYFLDFIEGAPDLRGGSRVRVRGYAQQERFVVPTAAQGGEATVTEPGVAASGPVGYKKVAVVMFNFSDDVRAPFGPAAVRSAVFTGASSTNAYFQETSAGTLWIEGAQRSDGDVFGWYTIPSRIKEIPGGVKRCQPADWYRWLEEADEQARADGMDPDSYDNLVYVFPKAAACPWSGLAQLPGRISWLNGTTSTHVVAHELAHNYGLDHAAARRCVRDGAPVAVGGVCENDEYGDLFDVMGGGRTGLARQFHDYHRSRMGWLPGGVVEIADDGVYTIDPTAGGTGIRALRIPRLRQPPGSERYFSLEYRRPAGQFDDYHPDEAVVNGVTVRIVAGTPQPRKTFLVDTTPETAGFEDAALAPGRSFHDPANGVHITTLTSGGSSATVQIRLAPTQPSDLRTTFVDTRSLGLRWTPSSDNKGVEGYEIIRDGVVVGEVSGSTFNDNGLEPVTTHTYQVVAYDGDGNRSAPSVPLEVTTLDENAPAPPAGLRVLERSALSVSLEWEPALGGAGVVGYRVFRDGTEVGTTAATRYEDSLALLTDGYEYRVTAYDAAGNESQLSEPVFAGPWRPCLLGFVCL